jgi:eukaryotic-like serine/threonine-protein kinase
VSQPDEPKTGGVPRIPGSPSGPDRMPDQAEATMDTASFGTGDRRNEGTNAKSIGPYRLISKLGEGGMGQVWLAEQTAPLIRLVAVKLIRAGFYDESLLQRFRAERQSLAIMNHPCIAKVFDAGATPNGQPYFVMEFVPGLSITDYCDQKKLKIRERLRLFTRVCEGVQHAHQKAVIHRDLKPANILIVEVDGKPMPRIIDFGIAKVVPSPSAPETLFTQAGGFLGTPGYMSPEQGDPAIEDVDTRTDVYSLGVVLYALLTNSLPFDSTVWKEKPWHEVLRLLREEDPPRPSTKISTAGSTQKATAELRSTEPRELLTSLRGDLDWITMKAIEKDRSRRYGTPSELAADIQRYLRHEPVMARPASPFYRMRKYIRRHRVGVGVAAAFLIVLVAFAMDQSIELRRITRERDRADRVSEFMASMFRVSDPSESRGNSVTAREILDNGSKNIEASLAKDPELQADLSATMAGTYLNLGLYSRALEHLERAVEIQRRVLGVNNWKTLQAMSLEGWILQRQGRYPESEKVLRETLGRQTRAFGAANPHTLSTLTRLGVTLADERRYPEAEKAQRQVLEIVHSTAKPDDPTLLTAMDNLASTLESEGHYAEAEKLQSEVLDAERRAQGEDYPLTMREMSNLANTLEREGKYADAERVERHAVELQLRVLGPQHPSTLLSMSTLATILLDQDHYLDAETIYRQILDAQRMALGPGHPQTIHTLELLGVTLAYEKHFPEAEGLFHQALKLANTAPGQTPVAAAWYNFACAAAVAGHTDEALHYLHEAVDRGYGPAADIASDEDLKSLRSDPRFQALLKQAQNAAAQIH